MATNSASTEISGPRKRKLSTKATTNGDPQEARKRQKSGTTVKKSITAALSAVKKGVAAALTKKKTVPSEKAPGTSKAVPAAPDRAPPKGPEKRARKRAPVKIEDIADDLDDIPSNPPQNPSHILEAADGSDDKDPDPAPELIPDDEEEDEDEDEDEDDEDETNLEATEESAEAELSTGSSSSCQTELITNQQARLSKDWTSPVYVFFRQEPRIEYFKDRRLHVFACAAGKCRGKNRRDVRRFLDTGDAKSTSGLRRHAKNCWGMRQWRRQTVHRIWRVHAKCWQRRNCVTGPLPPNLNALGKGK
jgi:hypothetical protein